MPGMAPESWGFYSDDGKVFHDTYLLLYNKTEVITLVFLHPGSLANVLTSSITQFCRIMIQLVVDGILFAIKSGSPKTENILVSFHLNKRGFTLINV